MIEISTVLTAHLDRVIEVILSRAARSPSGSADTQLFSECSFDLKYIKLIKILIPILNSSRFTQFDNDLGIFPVWSWLYLNKTIKLS